jgi:reactive chlorine resistance protein C
MNIQTRRILGLLSSSRSDWIGLHGMRIAIAIIFLWIGGLKFAP